MFNVGVDVSYILMPRIIFCTVYKHAKFGVGLSPQYQDVRCGVISPISGRSVWGYLPNIRTFGVGLSPQYQDVHIELYVLGNTFNKLIGWQQTGGRIPHVLNTFARLCKNFVERHNN
jgi:hypothetical protein